MLMKCRPVFYRAAFFAVRGRGRVAISVLQRPQAVESPTQGLGSTISLPRQNHLGDSRAERENDSIFSEPSSLLSATNRGILRLLAQALNDVQNLGLLRLLALPLNDSR